MRAETKNRVGVFVSRFTGRLDEILRAGVFAAAQHAAGEIRRVIMSTFKGRTGGMARSFKETFLATKDGAAATAGALSDSVYAPIQDEGGTIRPRSVQNLAIPLPAAGVPVGKWPRHYAKGELFRIKSKAGNMLLVKRDGKSIKPMFVLKPQVQIHGKGYLATALERAQPGITEILAGHVDAGVEKLTRETA